MSRRSNLMSTQEKVAAGMSGGDVRVVFTSRFPKVDVTTKEIMLPPPPEEVDEDTETNMRSWTDHESAHIRFGSKPWSGTLRKDKVLKALCYHLEDCRVDRKNGEKYAGTRDNRRRGFDICRPKMRVKNILQAAFYVLYEHVHGYFSLGASIQYWTKRLEEPMAAVGLTALMAAIPDHINRLKVVETQDEVITLSKEIKEIWKNLFKSGGEGVPGDEENKLSDGGMFGEKKEKKQEKNDSRKTSESSSDGQPQEIDDDDFDEEEGPSSDSESDENNDSDDSDEESEADGEADSSETEEGTEEESESDDEEDETEDCEGDDENERDEEGSEGEDDESEEDEGDEGEDSEEDDSEEDDSEGEEDDASDEEGSDDKESSAADGKDGEDNDDGDDDRSGSGDEKDEDDEQDSDGTDSNSDSDDTDGNDEISTEKTDEEIEDDMDEMMDDFKSVSDLEKEELENRCADQNDPKPGDGRNRYGECPEGYRPFTGDDKIIDLPPETTGLYRATSRYSSYRKKSEDAVSPAQFKAEVRDKLGTFQRRLLMYLMSRRRLWIKDREDGTLDDTRLYRVPTGDKRVFKRKLSRPSLNIAVSVLLDMSGSMAGYEQYLCAQLGYILAETCSLLRIPFETLGFTTHNYRGGKFTPYGDNREAVEGVYYHRTGELTLIVIKDFRLTKRSDMLHKFYAAAKWIGGGTVEGEAIWWAARRLAQQREQRKLLITICDGAPNGRPAPNWKFEEHVTTTLNRIRRRGIETMHVGIGTDAPERYVPRGTFVQYNGIDSLITEFAPAFGDILRGERRRNTMPIPI